MRKIYSNKKPQIFFKICSLKARVPGEIEATKSILDIVLTFAQLYDYRTQDNGLKEMRTTVGSVT